MMLADYLFTIAISLFILLLNVRLQIVYLNYYLTSSNDIKRYLKSSLRKSMNLSLLALLATIISYSFYLVYGNLLSFILTFIGIILFIGLSLLIVYPKKKYFLKRYKEYLLIDLIIYVLLLVVVVVFSKLPGVFYFASIHYVLSPILLVAKIPLYKLIDKRLCDKNTIINDINSKYILVLGAYGKTSIKNFIKNNIDEKYSTHVNSDSLVSIRDFLEDLKNEEKDFYILEVPYIKGILKYINKDKVCGIIIDNFDLRYKDDKNQKEVILEIKEFISYCNKAKCIVNEKIEGLSDCTTYSLDNYNSYYLKILKEEDFNNNLSFYKNDEIIRSFASSVIDKNNQSNILAALTYLYESNILKEQIDSKKMINHMSDSIQEGTLVFDSRTPGGLDSTVNILNSLKNTKGVKSIITSGFEGFNNKELIEYGKRISEDFKYIILIKNPKLKWIKKGLVDFSENALYIVKSIEDGTNEFFTFLKNKSKVLLICNDINDIDK